MRRPLAALAAVPAGAVAAWAAIVKVQGDSLITFEPEALTGVTGDNRLIHGEVAIFNRGKAGGVVHKVDGRLVSGGTGRVLVTRKDSRTPERGWWRSLCLTTGESCVAEVDIELEEPATGASVVIELDAHEVGRRLKVHRVVRLSVPVPAAAPATPAT
ncbi:MAG: hypothetical protein ACRD2W_14910 [Acidimicrobiales bacterium]